MMIHTIGLLLLAQEEAPTGGGSSLGGMLIPILLIFAVLYFLILRPQRKKEKQRTEMLKQIRKGDRIVTIGGIHGEIQTIKGNNVILLVDAEGRTTLKVSRQAVHRILTDDSDEDQSE